MNIFRYIYHFYKLLLKLNVSKTIYINFKMLPFNKAIKFPIYLYGKVYIWDLSGSLEISDNITPGMIKIGYKWHDLWPVSFLPAQIQNKGKLVFRGECIISGGVNLNVQAHNAILDIGAYTMIGGGSVVKCLNSIQIGEMTGLTGNCCVMDCNMHFLKNVDNGTVANYTSPIIIGKKCWLNYGTIVSKGAIIPDYSITSRNSFVSKDFSKEGSNLFLVGSPCKVASQRVQRIFSTEKQEEYINYYKMHDDLLQLKPGIEIETGKREGF